MGVVGGIVGASAGTIVVVAVAAARDWTPVMDPWMAMLAPFAGGMIGLLAGACLALRAAFLEPVDALRSGT